MFNMTFVDIDFETSSACELKTAGAWAYAEHPTTDVLVLTFHHHGYEDGPFYWCPGDTGYWHGLLTQFALDPNVVFVAHNAGFEQAIWSKIMVERFGFPPIPVERWEDTMATAAWKAIPLALDKGAAALRLPVEKDKEGNRLTLSMSRPDKKTGMVPELTPERLARISEYCARDVVVETAMRHRIGLLSQQSRQERGIWLYDQTINQRGVRIDLDFVRQAQLVIERASKPLLAEFRELTGGVNPGQVAAVKAWAAGQGVELENLQKGYLTELLGEEDDDGGYTSLASEDDAGIAGVPVQALPQGVRRVLEIRQMLGSASIKKLDRMQRCVCEDGRVRGLLQYHAAGTGRWGGRLFQPQNFPRGVLDKSIDPAMAVDAIMTGDPENVQMVLGIPAIECVASSLRHALVPDVGKSFLVGDFAGIEARIVLAMAGQHDKLELIAAGENPYLDFGAMMFGHPIDKGNLAEYVPSKSGVLGCGFQCGPANFNVKFLGGKDLPLAEKVVSTYRKEWAPLVPKLWYGLNDASLAVVETKRAIEAYGVQYKIEDDWLTAQLPSGWQKLWYHAPLAVKEERYHLDGRSGMRRRWEFSTYKGGRLKRGTAYGGLLVENAVQGLARGLLCAAIDRLERAGMPVVLTVHDEAIVEIDEGKADLAAFEQLMAEPTPWAREMRIPIAVEAWRGDRYRK